ncbi:hypothetical protein AGABI1DRAFT_134183 [Agaricus bisporus var. burnettii JB137-S8]|uniref:Uncharacterized protein n=1 Tax=Agaricus bisporus var. burnettii (strain JB137-S8 / ATCC MYA-4627 / FGSC 10392) TaxID=597362 RepID=K5WEQ4_AGABU|nr:uncharacterized protein AGABI1DRAFT_134183 [Agaricus bisporus var. burnettii JB137-S8]EKM73731.1 hypothetical protein AGABI1DRAFT_134183 [Agaricus bisporus var. burnettii JB137-S8]
MILQVSTPLPDFSSREIISTTPGLLLNIAPLLGTIRSSLAVLSSFDGKENG